MEDGGCIEDEWRMEDVKRMNGGWMEDKWRMEDV